jgi:hypothetical protein
MIAAAAAAPTSNYAISLQGASAVSSEKSRSVRDGWMAAVIAGLKEFGPYAAIELVLPGGSLIAILLWLHRRHRLRLRSNPAQQYVRQSAYGPPPAPPAKSVVVARALPAHFAGCAVRLAVLKRPGVSPVAARNASEKFEGCLNPNRYAISFSGRSVCSK